MRLIRYIDQNEYDRLTKGRTIYPLRNTSRAWSGRIYFFPEGLHEDFEYEIVAYYLMKEFNLDYQYGIIVDTNREEYVTQGAYDKERMDEVVDLGYPLNFKVDEDAYDTGAVYVVDDVRLLKYDLTQVVYIQKI